MKISRILVACLIASMGSAAFAAKFNLKMGHAVNTTDGQHAAAMKLAELVKQRTNGDVEITIFPANQLGNDAAMINGVRGGTIDIVSSGGVDRWPWLDRIAHYLTNDEAENAQGGIVACSALKRIYRDRIRQQAGPVVFLFLDGHPDLIRQRMQQRIGHYMQPGLLDSQLQTLEKPSTDESDVITLSIDQPVAQILQQALTALKASALNALP